MAAVASGRPAPRYATTGEVFVTTLCDSNCTFAMSYTPLAIMRVMNGSTAPPFG